MFQSQYVDLPQIALISNLYDFYYYSISLSYLHMHFNKIKQNEAQ